MLSIAGRADVELMEILWDEQRSVLAKPRGQHKWHPKVINWCLQMYHSSHSKYKQMTDAGFLLLPHPRTLQRHAHKLDVEQGVTKARFDMLAEKLSQYRLGSEELVGMLVYDEMHIQVRIACVPSGIVTPADVCSRQYSANHAAWRVPSRQP